MSRPDFFSLQVLGEVEGLAHGFFPRRGGLSPSPYDGLNLSTATGDSEANVRANLALVRRALGFERLVSVHQVHGEKIAVVGGRLPAEEIAPLAEADGLITDRPGLGLVIKIADCQAVLAVDPVRRVVGAVHVGWRGLIKGAIPALIEALVERYGSRPAELRAGLSPSLGPCCAEFVNYRHEFPEAFWAYRVGRNHFDLRAAARRQLVEAGLEEANIDAVELCTRCRGDLFFSHRGQGPATGRFGAVIGFLAD